MRWIRRWAAVTSLFALFACDVVTRVERPLPEDFSATLLSGEVIDRTYFEGRPWLVNVWVPGCGICAREFAAIEATRAGFEAKGVGYLALSMEADDEPVRTAAKRIGIAFPVAIMKGPVLDALDLRTVPATFFLDARTNLVAIARGERTRGFFERRLKELVTGSASDSL